MRRASLISVLTAALGCTPAAAQAAPPTDRQAVSRALESLAAETSPGVVHVVATGYVAKPGGTVGLVGRERSLGSGFVLDADGVIVTNAHVVFGADRIDVTVLQPSRQAGRAPERVRLRARIIGLDVDSDLALLKVEAKGLHPLVLGDSDKVRPGQLVFAFGSPLGLEGTISMGIVGASERQPDPDDPLVFIQTDAAINPGNSGGPLVNAAGEVIGVNTMILSASGGSQGLGFAIPSDTVAQVARQLKEDGRVWHGTLGLVVQSVTPLLASDLGLSRTNGALVVDVLPGGPGEDADVEVGDLVVSIDNNPTETGRELNARIHNIRPGRIATLGIVRGTEKLETAITAAALPGDPREFMSALDPREHLVEKLGVLGIDVDRAVGSAIGGLRSPNGVLVVETEGEVLAPGEGVRRGDVIVNVGRRPVDSLGTLRGVLADYPRGTMIVLRVERGGRYAYVSTEVE